MYLHAIIRMRNCACYTCTEGAATLYNKLILTCGVGVCEAVKIV